MRLRRSDDMNLLFWKKKQEKDKDLKYKDIYFEHLAPIDTVKDVVTFEALDYALSQNNIYNIALTGNYGSGKSSVLQSYMKQNKTNKFLNISLATFAIEEKDENVKTTNNILPETTIQKIEKSILQQILYKKPGNKFPYSRFNRIKRLTFWHKIWIEFVIIFLLLFPIKILKNDFWLKMKDALSITFNKEATNYIFGIAGKNFLLVFFFLITFFIALYNIISIFNRIRLTKFTFQKAEFGLGDVREESLLNRYLDEVLYFFETTNFDVVIIEDLDRFNNTEIFIKLRELNTLLNNYEKIKRRIIFIYALRDEVFKDSSRTKFFEFIIPVIPVINTQNSSDKLLEVQSKNANSVLAKLDKNFLQDIGLYIDDMRLLKNCINEFKIYDKKINGDDYTIEKNGEGKKTKQDVCHDRNKIFALILYKNLYPKDFSDLSKNTGFLYSVIKSKEDYISKQQKEYDDEILELIESRKEIEKFEGFPIKQLRQSYLLTILNKSNHYINLNSIDTYLSDEAFNKMIDEKRLYIQTNTGRSNISFDWEEIQNTVNPQYSYAQNEKYINDINNGQIEAINSEIKSLKEKKDKLLHSSLNELNNLKSLIDDKINVYSKELNESYNGKKKDSIIRINTDLVYYLLNNGYIDEDYFDYISYFYPGALSQSDKQFLLLIKGNKEPVYNQKLNKIENLINRIRPDEWTRDAILNNDLLCYVLEKSKSDFLDDFVSVMYVHDSDNIESSFYSQFTCNNETLYKKLDFCLNKHIEANNYHYDKIFSTLNHDTLFRFFKNVEINNNSFKLFIHDNIKFLCRELSDDEIKIIENKLINLDQKFSLCIEMKQYPIYDLILKNKLYEVNLSNLLFILDLNNEQTDDLISKLNNCVDYVQDHFYQDKNTFVEKILLVSDKLHETEVNIKKLITDDSIFCGLRKKLIKQNDFMLNDINSFPKEIHEIMEEDTNSINLWKILLSNNKIISVWNNILVYYEEYGLDDSLIEFINNNIDEVSKSLLLKREELDDKENNRRKVFVNLFSDLLVCDLLSNDVFKTVTEKCPFIYKEINISALNESKVKILCENNKLSYNQTHINMIRDKSPEFLNIFINKNIKSALKKENVNFITVNDIQNFLCSSEISNDSFISFIENENFLWEDIYNEKVSKKVINYVVEKSYRKKIAVQLSFVIKKMIEFEYKINQIIRFLNLQIDNYSTEEIKYSLELLDSPYKNLFTKERKQLEMIQADFNEELCNNLKNKNLISSYSKDSKGNIKINRKLK